VKPYLRRLIESHGQKIDPAGSLADARAACPDLPDWQTRALLTELRRPPVEGERYPGDPFAESRAAQARRDARRAAEAQEPADKPPTGLDDGAPDEHEDASSLDRRYVYDREGQRYIFPLRTEKHPRVIPAATLQAMKRAYSDHDGAPCSIESVAMKFRLRREVFLEIKSILGWTHGSIPFTDEEVDERHEEEILADAATLRREGIYHKIKAEEWAAVRADAVRWRRLDHSLSEVAQRFAGAPARVVEPLLLPASLSPFAAVLPIQDLHIGQISDTEDFGYAEVRRRMRGLVANLVARLPGRPERLYLTVGGDFWNVDGGRMATTKGTPQLGHATPADIFEVGLNMLIEHIESARQVAPVSLVHTPGNHDDAYSRSAWVMLRRLYQDAEGVTFVNPGSRSPRQYAAYGRTLLMFSHGHGAKPKNLGSLAATEARALWGQTEWTEAFYGHFHSPVTRDAGGATLNCAPSATVESEWEHLMGFEPARRGMMIYLIERDVPGVTCTLFAPLAGLDAARAA